MYRGRGEDGRVLVTMTAPQTVAHAELVRRLAIGVEGITPLLDVTTVVIEGVPYDVLVEAEPEGAALTNFRMEDSAAVARGLAAHVARAHAAGRVLGGIRPELVYTDGYVCTGLAPRAEWFFMTAGGRCYGVPPCFDEVYLSPEMLSLAQPTPASDVFSLCATLAWILDGVPPFPGRTLIERLGAAMQGSPRRLDVDPVIVAGMRANPADRPQLSAIQAVLA
jgi:hypothetical protein